MTKSRITAAYLFVIFGIAALLARYAYLQIADYQALLAKSIENYTSVVAAQPVRGAIIDHNGVILADNRVSYAVAVLPKDAESIDYIFGELQNYINLTAFDKKKYFKQLKLAKNYDWVIIKDDLSNTEVANLTAHAYLFPQLNVFAHTKRYYPFSDLYAHSVGYVGRISQNDKQKLEKKGLIKNYLVTDYIGKHGLEQEYESYLRGTIGKKVIRTDAYGNEVGLINNQPAIDGYTLQLTIDNKLQEKASQLLGNRKGAIIALDPQTGGVLAFVSKPSYDANLFLDGISPEDWEDLQQDSGDPLLNRASQGTYPPGSTFKPFLAAAALYLGVRTPEYRYDDIGYYSLPGSTHRFRNSGNEVFGLINIVQAIAYSSDAFFFKLGLDMGVDRMDQTLPMFGLGHKTGIDLPDENSGLLPSRAWKARRFAKNLYQRNWLPADSVTMGIGQGFNHYTPLQMAFATSILANEGIVHRPHFLERVMDKSGNLVSTYHVESAAIKIPKQDLQLIKSAMQKVIQFGTAKALNVGLRYTMAGKTGTAQVVGLAQGSRKAKFVGAKYRDHSWFIAFAPVDKPKIVAAIVVENGGWGVSAAGAIARNMFDSYLLPAPESTDFHSGYKKFNDDESMVEDDALLGHEQKAAPAEAKTDNLDQNSGGIQGGVSDED